MLHIAKRNSWNGVSHPVVAVGTLPKAVPKVKLGLKYKQGKTGQYQKSFPAITLLCYRIKVPIDAASYHGT